MTPARAGQAQSWQAFKIATFQTATVEIEGVSVPVPSDMPLNFGPSLAALGPESDISEFGEAVALMYGDGVFEQWVTNGMGVMGLLTALMWGYMKAGGQDVTFFDAYQVVTSDDPGKAVAAASGNRAARRSQSKPTGGRSSRTSAASTASPRPRSRT